MTRAGSASRAADPAQHLIALSAQSPASPLVRFYRLADAIIWADMRPSSTGTILRDPR